MKFTKGQKVRTCYGEIREVLSHVGCMVNVYEETTGYHQTNVFPIKSK